MKTLKKLCILLGICVVISISSNARAQGPIGGWYPWAFYGNGIYRGANRRVIPYFALHPPVYYSQVVPRPYGYSPFALPPGVKPVEAVPAPPKPKEVANPYFRPKQEKKPTDKTAGPAPRVIENPFFVESAERGAADKLADN